MTNLMPDRYREVSLAKVDHELSVDTVRRYLIGREVYRRTRFVVMRSDGDAAVAAVTKADEGPLFAPVVEVEVLALPSETTWVDAPDVDTSVPSQLARAAREHASGARCVIVAGRHGHVSFLLDPTPVRVRIVDVAPPYPAKLVDQAQAVLDVADDMPPTEIVADVIDLADLAGAYGADRYLFPCRGSGLVLGADTAYLDERPPDGDWVLVGCARSREIHRWFYHRDAPSVEMCPRLLAATDGGVTSTPTLTRCCLIEEERYDRTANFAVLPWGASLSLIRTALSDLIGDGGINGSTAD